MILQVIYPVNKKIGVSQSFYMSLLQPCQPRQYDHSYVIWIVFFDSFYAFITWYQYHV